MSTDVYDYYLPEEQIAQQPLPERAASRLMILDRVKKSRQDCVFRMLPTLLRAGDLLVLNDTKVIPARLFGRRPTGGAVELLIERFLEGGAALVSLRASKKPRPGEVLMLDGGGSVTVRGRRDEWTEILFGDPGPAAILEAIGHVPLPPYIRRSDDAVDRVRYQTIYAREPGAVAAPTAGLHFDEQTFAALAARGVETAHVTLHVGSGTFRPLREDTLREGRLHAEFVRVDAGCVARIMRARAEGGRVIAVGTTSARALETAARSGILRPYEGDTDLFIRPGHAFSAIDGLLTNFHLPKSSLLMLVSAFAGTEFIMDSYRHAVAAGYRFFSYGDAMLLRAASPVPLEA